MKKLFDQFKNSLIVHKNYQGYVCGYNDEHFILAVETTDTKGFFRVLKNDFIVLDQYKDTKYRYVWENESEIIKQTNTELTLK